MSRYKRMKARTIKPRDERIGMLFDDMVELGVEDTADLAYRTSIAKFEPISKPENLSLAFDCFELLEQSGLEFWVTGGWVADVQLGRVLRDHDDLDLFVAPGIEAVELRTQLRSIDGIQVLPGNDERRSRGEQVALFRERLPLDFAIVERRESIGMVWGGWFEFDLNGLEERKRRIVWEERDVTVRCLSPELHYLFKLAGLKHFKHQYRAKDLADIRAILPILNVERLTEAKSSWRERIQLESPAPAD